MNGIHGWPPLCVTLFDVAAREYVAVRLSADGLRAVDGIAFDHFDGNRSLAIRRLLALGVAAWAAGIRAPADIRRKR